MKIASTSHRHNKTQAIPQQHDNGKSERKKVNVLAVDKVRELKQKLKELQKRPRSNSSVRQRVVVLLRLAGALLDSDCRAAESYARRGLKLADRIGYQKGRHSGYRLIAISYQHRGRYEESLAFGSRALQISRKARDKRGIADALLQLGNVHTLLSSFDKALDLFTQALKIFETIGAKRDIAFVHANIGAVYYELKDFEQAAKNQIKALRIFKEINSEKYVATAEMNIAGCYGDAGNYDDALKYAFRSLATFKKLGLIRLVSNATHTIALIYSKMNDDERALEYLAKALKIKKEIKDKRGMVETYHNIGEIYFRRGRYDSARTYLHRALNIARTIGSKNTEIEICKILCQMHEAQRNCKKALEYHKKYTALKDELYTTEKTKQIAQLRTKYETEQKEKEAKLYRLRNIALRREINKRRKVEQDLEEHRAKLESIVAKRTKKLRATNIELRKEIAERKRAEKELLGYQKQLRALTYERGLIEERERRKVAAALHDDISQSLMIVKSTLDTMATERSGKVLRQKLDETRSQVAEMIQRTRSMTFEISPPVLYELGLEPAVEWLVENFQNNHGITCEYRDDGKAKPVSPEWRSMLFQSTRELLANVRKHARASKVLVSTCRKGNRLRLVVADDGVGFDPNILEAKIKRNEAFGLFNLRERMTHLRGDIDITSRQGKGTTITLLAPLQYNRHKTTRTQA